MSGGYVQSESEADFEEAMDAVVSLPGKVIEVAAETVIRLPEIPIKIVEGTVKGVEEGVKKLEKAFDQ